MNSRVSALNKLLKNKGLGAFLVTEPANIYYLSGFKPPDASLVITGNGNFIITDFRYKEDAQGLPDFKLRLLDGAYSDILRAILKERKIKKGVGFEAGSISYAKAVILKKALQRDKVRLVPCGGFVEGLRMIKDKYEIRCIKKAIDISRKALAALKIDRGNTEKEVCGRLDNLIADLGADSNAFTTIIASGANSSRPHAEVSDKRIGENEPIIIDFGVKVGMYNCDLTRVKVLGKIQGTLSDIYHICREAQSRAIKAIRPGIKASAIDKIARDYIASKGFGEYFGHALGHGVGIAVHELPRISAKSKQVLKPDMVFTVEPGIYIENLGGVRVEDMVRVTERGCEVLTDDIPK